MSEAALPPSLEIAPEAMRGTSAAYEGPNADRIPGLGEGDPQAEVFQRREVIVIPERGVHIPSFYIPHAQPDQTVVVVKGVPLQSCGQAFTVAHVAPERRWAIAENGEVMDNRLFRDKLKMVREEWFASAYREGPQKYKGDISKFHTPHVFDYVRMQVNPARPRDLIPIHYDPHPNAKVATPFLYDPIEDRQIEGTERIALLRAAYANPELRKTLRPNEIEEIEALDGKSEPVQSEGDLVTRLNELGAKLASGEMSAEDYATQVSALTGHVPESAKADPQKPPPKPKTKRRPALATMPCGEKVYGFNKKRHTDKCEVCQAST